MHAGRNRRHAAMNRVETVRFPQEIRRRFARATDARKLGHFVRVNARLIKSGDNMAGDAVMSAAHAEGAFAAEIVGFAHAEAIGFYAHLNLASFSKICAKTLSASIGSPSKCKTE